MQETKTITGKYTKVKYKLGSILALYNYKTRVELKQIICAVANISTNTLTRIINASVGTSYAPHIDICFKIVKALNQELKTEYTVNYVFDKSLIKS
jgi:F0F1-type ATP synthase delta subunit